MICKYLTLLALMVSLTCLSAKDYKGKTSVKFTGTSTLHDFEGSADAKVSGKRVSEKGSVTWSFSSSLKVNSMSTNKKSRDKNMRKMFHESKHPTIDVSISGVDVSVFNLAKVKPQDLISKVTIAGTTKSIKTTILSVSSKEDRVSFQLRMTISLKDFKLKRPTAMLGMIKVGDEVKVSMGVSLKSTVGKTIK